MADPQPRETTLLRSNLGLRVVAALILAPFAIAAAWIGGWPWHLLALLVAVGLFAEWLAVIGLSWRYTPLIAGGAALLLVGAACIAGRFDIAAAAFLVGLALVAALAPSPLRLWSAMGLVYAAAALVGSIVLRADAQAGFVAVLFVFAVVWASDICAYFAGRAIGGPKLWPRVSPKKTWSGAAGGFAGSIAVALAFAAAEAGSAVSLALLGALLSVAAQLGDLAESAVKRRFDVKDSSHIIPGHGGLMDRLDAFVAVVVVAALIGVWRAGPDAAGRGLLLW